MSEEPAECPLCMEPLEIDDHSFFPCTCGYQICRFCWHRIRTDENGLCPACRKQYPEDPAEFKPLTEDELQNIKKERKQKDVQRKQKAAENRKHLANVRVVQKNLVFVVGLSPRLADPEVLKKQDYFGKFGKIHKVVINQSTSYAGSQGPSASAYVTYVKPDDAIRAILNVNNVHIEGRTLKTSLGTTKYCSHFLKGSHCQKNDCMYLHELGEEAASFTKDEMQAGKHQEYEQMLIEQFLNTQNTANNHHIANNKIKKSVSPQAIETTEVIPSLMDMTGDIKHTLSNSGPLLPNPVLNHNGSTNNHAHFNNSNSVWHVIEGSGSSGHNGTKNDHSSNNVNRMPGQSNKFQNRTNTPPNSGGNCSRAVGNGRQRGSSSEENHVQNPINPGSGNRSPSITPPGDIEKNLVSTQNEQPNHRGLPLPNPNTIQPVSPRSGASVTVSPAPITPSISTSVPTNNNTLQLQQQTDMSSTVGAIGSNRRSGLQEANSTQGLSFFEMPNNSLVNQEMADTLPVSTCTDWVEAFGLKNKDVPAEDDLGFDPCAESFKGLADLIEKENGMQQQHLHLLHHQHNRLLGSPPQSNYAPHPLSQSPLQNNTLLRNLPPGFSMSHIQQQQMQQHHYFRQDLANSKMPEILPQFSLTGQRYPPLHYHNMPFDLHTSHQQQPQRELYNMKDMQEQLRSMLPNINISFGSIPHQQAQQQLQQVSTSLFSQQSQHLNKSWPLSSSPDSSLWNDPAIVSTSHINETGSLFPDASSHWLKSLHHPSESEGSSHRLPFVQQFPLGGTGGWPPHTHNPPPGFRTAGLGSQTNTDTHQMTEVLQ